MHQENEFTAGGCIAYLWKTDHFLLFNLILEIQEVSLKERRYVIWLIFMIWVFSYISAEGHAIAAALQLETVIPNFIIHGHHQFALFEENIVLCEYNYQPTEGYYTAPDLPGIGNEVTEETIRKAEVMTIK